MTAGNRAVHEGQKLRHYPLFHISDDLGALRGDGIHLIDEDDARRFARRFFKYLTQPGLTVTVIFLDDFRPVDSDEMELRLSGNGTGNQGFPRSRRSVEKQPFRRLDAQSFEEFPVT